MVEPDRAEAAKPISFQTLPALSSMPETPPPPKRWARPPSQFVVDMEVPGKVAQRVVGVAAGALVGGEHGACEPLRALASRQTSPGQPKRL
jgi:hypothetical protein